MTPGAYRPYQPARHAGGKPGAKPSYRVLVRCKFAEMWTSLPQGVGLAATQQFYDHDARRQWIPAVEILAGLSALRPDHTGTADELREILADTTDDLPPASAMTSRSPDLAVVV